MAALFVSPPPAMPFSVGGSCLGCPGTAPGGEGRSSSTCAAEVAASAPCCTINEGDPYVAVVQPVYLARHLGGAVHILAFASFHGVRTSVV